MARQELEIANGFYTSDSLPLSAQRCINWIPVIPQAAALSNRALFDVPGLTLLGTADGVNRGAQEMDEVAYFVNGSSLYSVASNGVSTERGSIEGVGHVSLANNGQFLVIVVPGGKGYAYDNQNNTLTQITDPSYRPSSTVVYKDGLFVFSASDGKVFFNSNINNPFQYDGLDVGASNVDPDKIVALHVNHNELFVCNLETIELFQNIGGSGFPYQRIQGANIQKGVHAPFSLVNFDNTFIFIGGGQNEKAAIWKVAGSSSVQKVSTSAIDTAIQQFTTEEISNAFSWTYSEGGNFFAGFTFESTRIPCKTFVYDATTSILAGESTWHERQSGVKDNSWRVASIVSVYGKLLVGDSLGGNIGFIDKTNFTEYGDVMVHERSSQPFSVTGIPLFTGELQLTMESGVGLTIGQGSDPQIRMSFSDDGGRTFSSEFWRSYGKIGEYTSVPTWRRQGRIPKNRVLRFRTSEPVKSVITKLEVDIQVGNE